MLKINTAEQTLSLLHDGEVVVEYPVSTAKKGLGEQRNSEQTPRGRHIVRAKIGAGAPLNTVFVGRRPTGEIYSPDLGKAHSGRDWILTRILWLSGVEPGKNRLGWVDTMSRFIYIHGAAEEDLIGQPVSHGCIRMKNHDIVSLFDKIRPGEPVSID